MDKRHLLTAIFFLLVLSGLTAQVIPEMEFYNRPVPDILLALSDASGRTIIPDETVTGTASYYFREMDINEALEVFLNSQGLFAEERNGIVYVSRVKISSGSEGLYSVDAEDVQIQDLLRIFSRTAGRTILYDALPRETLSIHLSNVTPLDFANTVIRRFSEYSIEESENYLYIKYHSASEGSTGSGRPGDGPLQRDSDGTYSVAIEQGRFRELVADLFTLEDEEWVFLGRNDPVLHELYFQHKTFDEMLRILLDLADSDISRAGDITYIVDIQRNDVLKRLYSTVYIPLEHISASDLPGLFPTGLVTSSSYKIDKNANALILYGTLEVIGPVQEYVELIDRPVEGREYRVYTLNYLDPDKVKSLLPVGLQMLEIISIKETGCIVALVSEAKGEELAEYLRQIDRPQSGYPVQLRYIKAEQLLENLPPSVTKDEISQTVDPTLVFFKGSQERLSVFLEELEEVDKPVPQIRYELLVVQVFEDTGFNFNTNDLGVATNGSTPGGSLVAGLASALSLKFDVISAFGLKFGLDLSSDISTNRSRLMADTTLNGLSGEKIKFQNTDTFRYQEVKEDDETGDTISGDTQEITSGLFLDLDGWVSGDGEITIEVSATVSQRADDSDTSGGGLPRTSEKIITTRVRTRDGEPVVIGGLVQEETSKEWVRVPILGDIPLLGLLFQKRTEIIKNTEIVIYLVPFIEGVEYEPNDDAYMERLFNRFIVEDL